MNIWRDFAFACDRATSGAAKPGNGASLSRARREGPRAGDPFNVARCAEHWRLELGCLQSGGTEFRSGPPDFSRPRDFPDRESAARSHCHRLQRRRQITAGAGHRHHEPCADTHYTDRPDPAIKHVLRGWGETPDQPANWDLKYRDVRVRNVPTNIRSFYGSTTTERYGNSIFIFEIANLCIAHLGHLHHTLTQQQLNEIGRIDVVMAPVDGSYTLDLDGMMEVLTALKAPLIIPMHFYGQYILDRFLDRARKLWDVETAEIPSVVVSKAMLPAATKVLVLPGRF